MNIIYYKITFINYIYIYICMEIFSRFYKEYKNESSHFFTIIVININCNNFHLLHLSS